jgi:hypothetical protein
MAGNGGVFIGEVQIYGLMVPQIWQVTMQSNLKANGNTR